jgi:hypothetical protein
MRKSFALHLGLAASVAVIAASASGCAAPNDDVESSAGAAVSSGAAPLVVLVGGYNSCMATREEGEPLAFTKRGPAFVELLEETLSEKMSKSLDVVSSCFGHREYTEKVQGQQGEEEKTKSIVQLSILDTKTKDVESADAYDTERVPTLDDLTPSIDRMAGAIKRAEQRQPGRPVILIGHSHGGWMALKLATRLPAAIDVRALVTLDPISPLHCSVANAFSMLIGSPPPGCTQAPPDIDPAAQLEITKRVGVWQHYYQTQFSRLHSGPFSTLAKERSVEVRPPGGGVLDTAHSTITSDEAVWFEASQKGFATIEGIIRTALAARTR